MLACHDACHLIRAIGHHIDRLACRSVSIMGLLSAHSAKPLFANPRIDDEQSLQRRRVCRVPSRLGAGLTLRLALTAALAIAGGWCLTSGPGR